MTDADEHRSRYFQYDRRVDIVSVAEVWFTRSAGLSGTVSHFERFPRCRHPDGNPATPDFTVLFNDGTALIGELSNLALNPESLESLASQIGRYDSVTHVPAGPPPSASPLQVVAAIDVVVITPLDVMNAACDRLAALIADETHPYKPSQPPMVLGWGYDTAEQKYTFVRPQRAGNAVVRDHGRSPSLGGWLSEGSDTLRGLPHHFLAVKASARFMNDSPPPLYTATVLWSLVLPSLLADSGGEPPADMTLSVEDLVARLRDDYGYGTAADVRAALDLLKVARLAEESGAGWTIYYRDLGRIDRDVAEALLHEYLSSANKQRPVRTATGTPSPEPTAEDGPEPLFRPDID